MTTPTKEREYPALPLPHASYWSKEEKEAIHAYADPLLDEIENLKRVETVALSNRSILEAEITELRATIERQREMIESCRGSVKADLTAYTQMQARGTSYNEVIIDEVKRLAALLDSIDAITALQAELKEKKE